MIVENAVSKSADHGPSSVHTPCVKVESAPHTSHLHIPQHQAVSSQGKCALLENVLFLQFPLGKLISGACCTIISVSYLSNIYYK